MFRYFRMRLLSHGLLIDALHLYCGVTHKRTAFLSDCSETRDSAHPTIPVCNSDYRESHPAPNRIELLTIGLIRCMPSPIPPRVTGTRKPGLPHAG